MIGNIFKKKADKFYPFGDLYIPVGVHHRQIRWNGAKPDQQIGVHKPGSFEKYRLALGLPKKHGAWMVSKAQVSFKAIMPQDWIDGIKEAIEQGFRPHVQWVEFDAEHQGPDPRKRGTYAQRATEFAGKLHHWLDLDDPRQVVLGYLNEHALAPTWTDTDQTFYEAEAQCLRVWKDLGWGIAAGGEASEVNTMSEMDNHIAALRGVGLKPSDCYLTFHAYGGSNTPPLMVGHMFRRLKQEMGFKAAIGTEMAWRVNPPAGPADPQWLYWTEACIGQAMANGGGHCFFDLYNLEDRMLAVMKRKTQQIKDGTKWDGVDLSYGYDLDAAAVKVARAAVEPVADWQASQKAREAFAACLREYANNHA
jgi:hypothetical protein